MCRRMIYACGVRLTEGTRLQVSDIDPARMLVRVSNGTGGNDRFVPLAPRVLEWLREYGPIARPRPWLFPARHRPTSLSPTTRQKTFKVVVRRSGLATDAAIHPLRHAYATHLLARRVPRRAIQALLGHKSPSPTARYTHLTPQACEVVPAAINALLADL
jgi:integrase/recombinase XerD